MTCISFSFSLPAQARLPGTPFSPNPKLYHRSMGPSFLAGAKTSLDGVIRGRGGGTVKGSLLSGHVTQSKSLCWLEHWSKPRKRDGKSGSGMWEWRRLYKEPQALTVNL